MNDLFTETEDGWSAFMSDLEGNITGSLRLKSGKEYANLKAFIKDCTPHYDRERDLTHWTFKTDKGKTVTIFNT